MSSVWVNKFHYNATVYHFNDGVNYESYSMTDTYPYMNISYGYFWLTQIEDFMPKSSLCVY